MRTGTDSFWQRTAQAATVGITLLVGEARADDPPIRQPEVPAAAAEPSKITPKPYKEQTETERKATFQKVFELLGDTNTDDDEQRMKALNTLEKELLPLGTTKLLNETRERIIQELKIDALAKALASQKGAEQPETVSAIMKLLEHNTYTIRSRAERILNEQYKDRRNEDPRYRPPDITHISQHIDNAPVHSVGDLTSSKSMIAFRAEIRKTIDKCRLPDFKQREQGRKELNELVRQMLGMVGVREVVQEELTPKREGKSWAAEWNDLEVRRSTENVLNTANREPPWETVYPPYRSTVGQVTQDMREFGNAAIRFANSDPEALDRPLNTPTRMSHSRLLAEICAMTGTYPDCDGSPTRLALKTQDPKTPREVIALDGAVGVVTPGGDKTPPSILLLPDPQAVFLDLAKAEGKQLNTDKVNLRISRSVDPDWKIQHGGGQLAVRQRTMNCSDTVRRDLFAGQGTVSYTVWTATHPVSRSMQIGGGAAFADGPQDVLIGTPEETETKQWKVDVKIGMYDGLIQWHQTPHESDTKTYASAEATDIRFFDDKGQEIEATADPMQVNMRITNRTYTAVRKPVRAKITTYRGIQEVRFDQPLNGSPAKRTIVSPAIKTTGNP